MEHHRKYKNIKERRKVIQKMRTQDEVPARPALETASINVVAFAEERAFEIIAMESALRASTEYTGAQRLFQRLPRHMRRRAASHNVKRLPARLRQQAAATMAQEPALRIVKKSTRRSKRRTATILEEYGKRQLDKVWLETHVWHAKRMQMQTKWGFRLAVRPNDKSYRSSYRSSKSQALLYDQSHTRIIEISAPENVICECMQTVLDRLVAGVQSMRYRPGHKYGASILYPVDSWPRNAICPIEFLWKPVDAHDGDHRTIWFFIHPAAFGDALRTIQHCFVDKDSVRITALDPCELNIFLLAGPRSHSIVQSVFELATSDTSANKEAHQMWEKLHHLRTPASLPAGVVISLTIKDPRANFPKFTLNKTLVPKDTPVLDECLTTQWPVPSPGNSLASSHIWDPHERIKAEKSKASHQSVNDAKGKSIVPGESIAHSSVIPILLVQRGLTHHETHGSNASAARSEFCNGWTIIFPKGWGSIIWRSLIDANARACGLLDLERSLFFECGALSFPCNWVGTLAYAIESRNTEAELLATFERKPPAKRGFNLLGWHGRTIFRGDFAGLSVDRMDITSSTVYDDDYINVIYSPPVLTAIRNTLAKGDFIDFTTFASSIRGIKPNDLEDALVSLSITAFQGTPLDHAAVYTITPSEFYEFSISTDLSPYERDAKIAALLDHTPNKSSLVGYVTSGHFSLSKGKGGAISFCKLNKLVEAAIGLRKAGIPVARVLVHNINGRRSRLASYEIKG